MSKIFKYKNILTKKYLKKEYLDKKKSMSKIAKEVGCSDMTIYDYLKKYKIKTRTHKEGLKGNKHPNYIDGRTNKKYYCKICGKNKISYKAWRYGSKTCINCYNKIRSNKEKNKIHYCKEKGCNNEISYTTWYYGQGRCSSCANKITTNRKWQNKEYREKTLKALFKGMKLKPNKPEKLLNKLLQYLLPKEYKFIGDWKVVFGGFNPDFINCNGQKKIIEMYGDYWHNKTGAKQRDKRRIIAYKQYGYKTLIIWEHELKDLSKVSNRIKEFSNGKERFYSNYKY